MVLTVEHTLHCVVYVWILKDAGAAVHPVLAGMRSKMKLCFVADANHANAANWLEHFATELGHEVHVISFTQVTREIKGVILYDLATRNKLLLLTKILTLRKLFRQIELDLVVAYRVQSYGFLSACTGFHPLILVAQSRTVVWPPNSRIMAWFCQYAIRRADWILSWAEHTTHRLIQLGADQSIIDTFPRGVRPELFFPKPESTPSNGQTIITTRSLEPGYKYDDIIHAVHDLIDIMPGLKYQIAGEGQCRRHLEKIVQQVGLNPHVEFLGYVPNVNLPDRLREADVYVSAYLEDGVSMSLLEAMACGLLPVVPDTEPNHMWIQDGVNGLLFRPGDHVSLVQKLHEALSNPSLRKKAREHNIKFIHEKVNWHTNMRRIEARFLQIIAQFQKC
jgi:glycosyltransferase involved in cell wall biosynthesis